ncbi:MAG: sulfatase [Polyangiaceae bacterium]
MRLEALAVALTVAASGGCRERPEPSGHVVSASTASGATAPSSRTAALPSSTAALPSSAAAPPTRATAAPTPARHLILLTVDALRADMPWLGYPRAIAPNLTRFAERSVVFSHAYALSSYTSMSLAGLMSGRYPSELPRDGRATSSFGPETTMLAEVLGDRGFHTLGVHGHVYFLGDTGIAQGFKEWHVVPKITSLPAREGHVVDDKIADMLLESLAAHERERPEQRLFAWAHFMDPHFSYAPHEDARYRGSPYETDGAPGQPVPPGTALGEIGQRLRNMYDGEVTHTDRQLGRVFDYLAKRPYFRDAAVVVTADHGEAFGEHKSYFEHGFLLYDVTTRVPLLIQAPGLAPRRIAKRRSHIDLARTVFELLAQKAPDSFRGESLVGEARGKPAAARPVLIDMPYTDQTPRRRALIQGDIKVVVTETEDQPLLFDLARDPGEQDDLATTRPKLRDEMMNAWKAQDQALPDFPAPRRSHRAY